MTLQASGAISISQINTELVRASTANTNLNERPVRDLAIVPAGVIAMNNFYSKSAMYGTGVFRSINRLTRINSSGTLVGESTPAGTFVDGGGAAIGSFAAFYLANRTLERYNSAGTAQTATTVGATSTVNVAGAKVDAVGVFTGQNSGNVNDLTVTRANDSGGIVGSQTSIAVADTFPDSGCSLGSLGIFGYGLRAVGYGGYFLIDGFRRINSSGTLVGGVTSAGTIRATAGAANIGLETAVFYGGNAPSNTVTRVNYSGTIIGSETSVGTARSAPGGAPVVSVAVFFAGSTNPYYYVASNIVTRIDINGTIVGSQTNVGTAQLVANGAGA
jgi:hypothetical protein